MFFSHFILNPMYWLLKNNNKLESNTKNIEVLFSNNVNTIVGGHTWFNQANFSCLSNIILCSINKFRSESIQIKSAILGLCSKSQVYLGQHYNKYLRLFYTNKLRWNAFHPMPYFYNEKESYEKIVISYCYNNKT